MLRRLLPALVLLALTQDARAAIEQLVEAPAPLEFYADLINAYRFGSLNPGQIGAYTNLRTFVGALTLEDRHALDHLKRSDRSASTLHTAGILTDRLSGVPDYAPRLRSLHSGKHNEATLMTARELGGGFTQARLQAAGDVEQEILDALAAVENGSIPWPEHVEAGAKVVGRFNFLSSGMPKKTARLAKVALAAQTSMPKARALAKRMLQEALREIHASRMPDDQMDMGYPVARRYIARRGQAGPLPLMPPSPASPVIYRERLPVVPPSPPMNMPREFVAGERFNKQSRHVKVSAGEVTRVAARIGELGVLIVVTPRDGGYDFTYARTVNGHGVVATPQSRPIFAAYGQEIKMGRTVEDTGRNILTPPDESTVSGWHLTITPVLTGLIFEDRSTNGTAVNAAPAGNGP